MKSLSLGMVLALSFVLSIAPLLAQGPPLTITPLGPIGPFNYAPTGTPIVIGGTKFPWQPRTGSSITMSQSFKVNNAGNLNGITVELNGRLCTVTGTPTSALWQYTNSMDPIIPGPAPSEWSFTVAYKRNGQLMVVVDSSGIPLPNPSTGKLWVVKVEHIDKGLGLTFDEVVTTGLAMSVSEKRLFTIGDPTRKIWAYFKVTAPSQAGNNLSGVKVGITQTLPGAYPGKVKYHRTTGGRTATLSYIFTDTFPMFDTALGTSGIEPFYSPDAVKTPGPFSVSGGVWENAIGDALKLEDSPSQVYNSVNNVIGDPGPLYEWGIINGNQRVRDGVFSHRDFEDMLTAYSLGCPAIHVAIFAFQGWDVNYTGYLDIPTGIWHGGTVGAFTLPVTTPETTHGPFNTKITVEIKAD